MGDQGRSELDRAFEGLEDEVPDRVSRAIRWLRDPKARKIRIPVGVLCLIGGLLWFLPVLGLELIPIGLLLIAQDVPFLRKPVGRAVLWLESKWRALRRRWRHRRADVAHRGAHGRGAAPARETQARQWTRRWSR